MSTAREMNLAPQMDWALKDQVVRANHALVESQLVTLTWGNASAIDRASGLVAIKPSGVDYAQLSVDDLVVLDLRSRVHAGALRPSTDTPTHLELYRAFDTIGAVVHTHSPYLTAFAQAGVALPCLGTTHADHFNGEVPLVRALSAEEVNSDYEGATGRAIVEHFERAGLDPVAVPGALLTHHAAFVWGPTPAKAVENAIALEMCARMALLTWQLNPEARSIPEHLLAVHHQRKHGPQAYYGQRKD